MKKRITTIGATVALVMSMGTAALAAPAQPGSGDAATGPQFHAGHWGYVQSGMKAKGIPALDFHDGTPYAPGLGGWANEVKQGGPFKG